MYERVKTREGFKTSLHPSSLKPTLCVAKRERSCVLGAQRHRARLAAGRLQREGL